MNIRQRIWGSFLVLVSLFILNGLITMSTLINNKKHSERMTSVLDPAIGSLDNFKAILTESKMYITNWVFFRNREEDKVMLVKLQNDIYPSMKETLSSFPIDKEYINWKDSLHQAFAEFEAIVGVERRIMGMLNSFEDYDDPVTKMEAERLIEQEIHPRTAKVTGMVNRMYDKTQEVKSFENDRLQAYSRGLMISTILITIVIIVIAFILSVYMTRMIISPVNRIRDIIGDLGRGVIRKIVIKKKKNDEISQMVTSVNQLSENLQATANFAHEIGLRNFSMPFVPLSDEDTLGKALVKMRDNLKHSQGQLLAKNKELEQFAYVASHDLQEPLRNISSFVELFQQQYLGRLDSKADKYLTYIVQSSDRMKVLITDLLDYSRIGRKKDTGIVNCNLLIKEVLADIGAAVSESNAIIHAEQLPEVNGYPTELKQLFQNLLVNAIKFRKKDVSPVIRISVKELSGNWQFAFADNGIGLSMEHSERIFTIFQRLHNRNEYAGSGIGLAHCRKIVHLHEGEIWVESEPGKGSTFYFTIPVKHKSINKTA